MQMRLGFDTGGVDTICARYGHVSQAMCPIWALHFGPDQPIMGGWPIISAPCAMAGGGRRTRLRRRSAPRATNTPSSRAAADGSRTNGSPAPPRLMGSTPAKWSRTGSPRCRSPVMSERGRRRISILACRGRSTRRRPRKTRPRRRLRSRCGARASGRSSAAGWSISTTCDPRSPTIFWDASAWWGLADDRVLVKKLLRGRGPDSFELHGQFGEPILDARVTWAAPVKSVTPR